MSALLLAQLCESGGRFETAVDRTPQDTAVRGFAQTYALTDIRHITYLQLREAQEEIDLVLSDDCQVVHLADLPLTVR